MIRILIVIVLFAATCPFLAAQDMPAYRIYTDKGKEVSFSKMMKSLQKTELVFFGELHNNPIAHWLTLEVAKSLHKNDPGLMIAMEMFEADDQIVLDEYLSGLVEEKNFIKEVKLWENYSTDYKPLVEFARKNRLRVVASNIPRRYANLVYRKGIQALDSLSDQARKWIVPLPVEADLTLSGYKRMIDEMKGHGPGNPENLALSQAVKDATMAYFILKNRSSGNTLLHVNGAYHSQDGEGILWYLRRSAPGITAGTIHVAEQPNIDTPDPANTGKADFIICVPGDMTKTY